MLLDFSKAYDTLDRGYLLRVLHWYGFPQRFVDIVQRLHTGTTATFLVENAESSGIALSCGIRQECPLAPLLFVLALEPLNGRISTHDEFEGVTSGRQRGGSTEMVRICGYADESRSWMALEYSSRSLDKGGLGVPDLRRHLFALSAAVTYRYAQQPQSIPTLHSRSLEDGYTIQPSRSAATAPKHGRTLFSTGVGVIKAQACAVHTPDESRVITQAWGNMARLSVRQKYWAKKSSTLMLEWSAVAATCQWPGAW
ncbi:TPA: hypothetical protein N0F65_004557 [Lagenidium giganteum]|uniref:Reverse transcriptase domain-containing protein n=1 Tax=Lagenidium giganteum TaxID=4803 RepID=A0AAV2ZF69_9STRA|nr:TPA: hypothetical protein N0F65_004557 [Lagenidium giganteum]